MPQNYNLQDPTELAIMQNDFENYSPDDWKEIIDFSLQEENKRLLNYNERSHLIAVSKKAGYSRGLSPKQISYALSLAEKVENAMNNHQANEVLEDSLQENHYIKPKNFTFRVAWHDNKWNGHVCNSPENNNYCDGLHSLLSERLRKRKEENIEKEIEHQGKPLNGEYLPPCFWGINIFGKENLKIVHDNPADKNLDLIKEELPKNSLFSWPFAVSFSRSADEQKIDGAYPKNLENVRIPKFQSQVKENLSIGFIYCKFSNPLTEEDQEYLVVGCGLITEKGNYNYFGPQEIIDKKRNSRTKYKNFPSMNWALRYSFQEPDMLVRMPYHEYISYLENSEISEDDKQKYLDRIKVAISEPELNHCFKYVAMDVDDDEAIFILTKMRKQLIDCKDDGIVPPKEMQSKISVVEDLLHFCWNKRTYFPGFASISREILNWDKPDFVLDGFVKLLKERELDDYADKFKELLVNPDSDKDYKEFASFLFDLKEKLEDLYGLNTDQLIKLSMLNLKPFQFKRILSGKLKLSGDWRKTIDEEKGSHSRFQICENPYLLYECYELVDSPTDPVLGEQVDAEIDLFKIDIAYFPDTRFGVERLAIQREMRITDKRRLRAVVLRYLNTLENTGHCFVSAKELEDEVKKYALFYNSGADYILPENFFENLNSDFIIHFEEDETKIKVVSENDTNYFYLQKIYNAENQISETIIKLLAKEKLSEQFSDLDSYLKESVIKLTNAIGKSFDQELFVEERKSLFKNIYENRFFVLAGSPGSGKSYELLKIVENWNLEGDKTLLLAPTGKAALRLRTDKDFKGIEASTIDKFLTKKNLNAEINKYNNIVIDEMSMVDLLKFRKIIDILNIEAPVFKRLILVGDPNQLPAIGYGKVLRDILYFLRTNKKFDYSFIELSTNCRQELADSQILEFAESYTNTEDLDEGLISKFKSHQREISKGFKVRYWNNRYELRQQINEEFDELCISENIIADDNLEKLNKIFNIDSKGELEHIDKVNLENFQILTPYRSDYFGSGRINDYFQKIYKKNLDYELLDHKFKNNDKIIRTKNLYKKGELLLSNGSIGFVDKKNGGSLYFSELEKNPMEIYGENRLTKSELENFDLAYAITVHKSQGSGFNHCFVIVPAKMGLLSKELIYTALTRSRKSVSLFVQSNLDEPFEKNPLEKSRHRSYSESRRTTLLLDKPYRHYSLEVDGVFVQSRVELMIYQSLKGVQKEFENEFSFEYEIKPNVDGKQLPMKTDFTIYHKGKVWYWEHLGLLGNRKYDRTWNNFKRITYQNVGVEDYLLTTDERNGINPDKIKEIIRILIKGELKTEDKTNRYSKHHYHLR